MGPGIQLHVSMRSASRGPGMLTCTREHPRSTSRGPGIQLHVSMRSESWSGDSVTREHEVRVVVRGFSYT